MALINSFVTLEEAITRANRLPYGLAAYAFSQDSGTRLALSRGLETDMLGINTTNVSMPEAPFGGVKESGIEVLQAYYNVRLVSEEWGDLMTILVAYVPRPEGQAALEKGIELSTRRNEHLVVVNASPRGRTEDSSLADAHDVERVQQLLKKTGLNTEFKQYTRVIPFLIH